MVQVIEVDKKEDGESFESLYRRFNKRVQQSGRLVRARQIKYFRKEKNKRALREDAMRREESRKKREHLRKIGRL
jgi:ribosomal protein S21